MWTVDRSQGRGPIGPVLGLIRIRFGIQEFVKRFFYVAKKKRKKVCFLTTVNKKLSHSGLQSGLGRGLGCLIAVQLVKKKLKVNLEDNVR